MDNALMILCSSEIRGEDESFCFSAMESVMSLVISAGDQPGDLLGASWSLSSCESTRLT